MLRNEYFLLSFLIATVAIQVVDQASAADPVDQAAVLAPFVNDDTFAIAYIDVGSLNAKNLGDLFASLPKLPDQEQAEMLGFTMVSGWVKSFQDAGGQGRTCSQGLATSTSMADRYLLRRRGQASIRRTWSE